MSLSHEFTVFSIDGEGLLHGHLLDPRNPLLVLDCFEAGATPIDRSILTIHFDSSALAIHEDDRWDVVLRGVERNLDGRYAVYLSPELRALATAHGGQWTGLFGDSLEPAPGNPGYMDVE